MFQFPAGCGGKLEHPDYVLPPQYKHHFSSKLSISCFFTHLWTICSCKMPLRWIFCLSLSDEYPLSIFIENHNKAYYCLCTSFEKSVKDCPSYRNSRPYLPPNQRLPSLSSTLQKISLFSSPFFGEKFVNFFPS
jgi:hypothetical protein